MSASMNDAMNAALRQAAGYHEATPDAADLDTADKGAPEPPTPAKAPGDEPAAAPGSADQGARSGPPPPPENPLTQAVRAWRAREGSVTL